MTIFAEAQLGQNQIPNDPQLKDLLDLLKKDMFLNLNSHHLATIQSFDPLKQTATATINYKQTYFQKNLFSGVYEPVLVDYPVLLDCPVICLGGGLGSLTFPITTGDECLVMFNDRDIDNWFKGSSNSGVATPRLHSFSDGIIIVGVRSLANVLVDYDSDAVALNYAGNKVRLYEDSFKVDLISGVSLEIDAIGKLKITNLNGEFVAMLVQLFTDIQNGLVSTLLGPQPLVMPTFTVDLAALQTFMDS